MGMTVIRFLALEIWQKEFKIMNRMSVSCFFYNFSPINDQSKRGLQPQQWLNGICIYLLWPGSVVTIVLGFFFGVQYHCRLHCDLNPKCFLQLTGPWLNYLDNSLCVKVPTEFTSKYKEWERHRQRERQKQSVGLFSTTDSSTVSNWRLWNGCVYVFCCFKMTRNRGPLLNSAEM